MNDAIEAAIETEHREMMNAVARMLDDAFKGYGFALLVFKFDDPATRAGGEGRMNYISNADRQQVLNAMKEYIAMNEGRVMPPSSKLQ